MNVEKINFRTATRQQAKASILIQGLSGTGKSGTALLIAHALAGDWKKVFALDSENKSLDLFDGLRASTGETFKDFLKYDLDRTMGYAPSRYIAAIEAAIKAGAEAVINDGITPMWQQDNGVLQLVNKIQSENNKYNKFSVWGDPRVEKEKMNIFSCIRNDRVHLISTVRVKEKFDIQQGEGVKSLGEQQQQMPDLKYEPDLVLDMVTCGSPAGVHPVVKVLKSRYAIFEQEETYALTPEILNQLVEYLKEGADPEELREKQRLELIEALTNLLDSDVSKRTMYPMLKKEEGIAEDVALADMSLENIRTLLTKLIN